MSLPRLLHAQDPDAADGVTVPVVVDSVFDLAGVVLKRQESEGNRQALQADLFFEDSPESIERRLVGWAIDLRVYVFTDGHLVQMTDGNDDNPSARLFEGGWPMSTSSSGSGAIRGALVKIAIEPVE